VRFAPSVVAGNASNPGTTTTSAIDMR
jgi:hypothetical protein